MPNPTSTRRQFVPHLARGPFHRYILLPMCNQPENPERLKMFGRLFAWLKSIENSLDHALGKDISTDRARRRARLHFHVVDHGILRTFWTNLFEIAPGVWRSNQPSQDRLRKYKAMGINTVLNLRGVTDRSPYLFEKEACHELGMSMVNHKLSARSLARKAELLSLLDTFETIQKPFVMHCKSGADRAGLAAALYLLHIEGASVEEARKQLSFKYVHIRASKTGVLDHMLAAYAADSKVDTISIRDWLQSRYNRKRLQASFDARRPPD